MAQNTIGNLRARIEAVCPVLGVVAYSLSDKSKWVVIVDPAATPVQQAAAAAVVLASPPLTPPCT